MENDLYQEIEQKNKDLEISIKKLRQHGADLAEKERAYRVLLRTESLKLRSENMPVTLIDKVVCGIPEVAEARFERDLAESLYDANREAINVFKLQLRLLESQLQREWGQAKE